MATTAENIVRGFLEEDRAIRDAKRRAMIEAMPNIKFRCGRNWYCGPNTFCIGVVWDKNLDAEEGELAYRRALMLHWNFRMWLVRS